MKLILRLALASVLVLTCSNLFAQSNTITFSATANYNGDLPKTIAGAKGILKSHEILPGGQVDLSAKLAGPIHLDLSLNYSQKPGNVQASFAGGPELVFGKNNQFFGHALVGGIHLSQAQPKVLALADSSFVYFVGGGCRHFFSKHLGFALGADYGYSEVLKSSDSLWKTSAGLVVRF